MYSLYWSPARENRLDSQIIDLYKEMDELDVSSLNLNDILFKGVYFDSMMVNVFNFISKMRFITTALVFAVPGFFKICTYGAEMFVADPGMGSQAIYVGVSDENGSFAETDFKALPLDNLMLPWAVAFDNRSRTVFWSDGVLDAILRANIDGTDQRIIVEELGYPAGLAIDTVNDRIYWTDYELDEVGSSTLDGTDRTVLVDSGLTRPEGITVSTRNNLLFWVDRGDKNNPRKIERVNTAGSQRVTIVSSGLEDPTAVSLNHDEDRLYWADFGRGRVESVTINGNDRREHVTMVQGFSFIKPYGLALLGREDKIFYSDNTKSVILEIDKSRRSEQTEITIQGNGNQFRDLRHIFISEFSEVICDPESKFALQQAPCPSTADSMTTSTTIVQDSTTTTASPESPNHTIAGSSSMSTTINSTTAGRSL
nr:low-density lipoprotein receptor-related protein 4-like [Lytechinus pictus]